MLTGAIVVSLKERKDGSEGENVGVLFEDGHCCRWFWLLPDWPLSRLVLGSRGQDSLTVDKAYWLLYKTFAYVANSLGGSGWE
jgi:hypothetical protein